MNVIVISIEVFLIVAMGMTIYSKRIDKKKVKNNDDSVRNRIPEGSSYAIYYEQDIHFYKWAEEYFSSYESAEAEIKALTENVNNKGVVFTIIPVYYSK